MHSSRLLLVLKSNQYWCQWGVRLLVSVTPVCPLKELAHTGSAKKKKNHEFVFSTIFLSVALKYISAFTSFSPFKIYQFKTNCTGPKIDWCVLAGVTVS